MSGEWADTAVSLDGKHAKIVMLQTPDGQGRVAFSVADPAHALEVAKMHCCLPLRDVATYQELYKLTYSRGPSGIIVMLAEALKEN